MSLPAEEGVRLQAAPEPESAQPLRPPLEAQLVQQGKLSMGQLAQAHRDRMENGGSVLDIVVERGWVSAEDVAALRAEHGVEPAEAAPTPEALQQTVTSTEDATARIEPVVEPETRPEASTEAESGPEPAVEPIPNVSSPLQQSVTKSDPAVGDTPAGPTFRVAIRLTNGELIVAGQAEDAHGAEALAQAVVADLATQGDSWPRFAGRYLRPETILSVDVIAP